jgi:hypothetical protein
VAAAFDAVATWLADPAPRCAWAREHVALRFARIEHELEYQSWLADMTGFYDADTITREDEARERAVERMGRALPRMGQLWRRDPASAAGQIRGYTPPRTDTTLQPDWEAIRDQVDRLAATCGWPALAPAE